MYSQGNSLKRPPRSGGPLVLLLAAVVFASPVGPVPADTLSDGGAVFIVTDPFGARVELDGVERGVSPLVLTGLERGTYSLNIERIGYHPVSMEIGFEPGRNKVVRFELSRSYVFTGFPEEEWVTVEDGRFEERFFALPPGTYGFDREGGSLSVRPQYPGQRVIDALNIAIPIVAAFTVALTVVEAVQPRIGGLPLSPFVISAYGIEAALIGADIGLYIHRGRFYRDFTYAAAAGTEEDARELFESGIGALDSGDLETAENRFEEYTRKYPSSPYTPEALYRIARINLLRDDRDRAEESLNRILQEYPVPEYYDQSQKLLSDIHLARGEYRESLRRLDSILYAGETYSREEVELFRCRVMTQKGLTGTGGDRMQALAEAEGCWQGLIAEYPSSENLPFYRYNLALVLGESGETEAAVELLDTLLAGDTSGVERRQMEILRRRFSPDGP